MKNLNIKPSLTVVVDVQTLTHVCQAGLTDTLLVGDLKRMGGMDALDKDFRTTYFIGRLMVSYAKGGLVIDQKAADWAFNVYQKANIDAKKTDKPKRTKVEENAYIAARKHFSTWRENVGLPAVQSRKDSAEKAAKAEKAKKPKAALAKAREKDAMALPPAELTPTANNASTADRFIRQQTAMFIAYCEKNKALIPDALRHAVIELAECVRAVPVAEAETDEA